MGFLAELDLDELPLFFWLLVKPLLPDEMSTTCWASFKSHQFEVYEPDILNLLTSTAIETLSWKKKFGFLHVVEDILAVFDESRIKPFLNILINCVVLISLSCSSVLGCKTRDKSPVEDSSSLDLGVHDNDAVEDKNKVILCRGSG